MSSGDAHNSHTGMCILRRRAFREWCSRIVHRYQYKGESHAFHGGVKVTYKDRLSRVGTRLNSEYGPIEKVSVPGPTPGSAPVVKTQETHEGVVFVPRPPDLRREPAREAWREEKVGQAAKACKKALTVRHKSDLSTEACREWSVLGSFHEKYTKASSVPNLPHTETVQGDTKTKEFLKAGESAQRTFDGTPQALLPLLERMSFRFPRPLITWDIFSEEAPSSFPSSGRAGQQPETTGEGPSNSEEPRDPRKVNHVVHKGQTQGQWKRGQKEVAAEEKAVENSGVLAEEDLEEGNLYIVKLTEPDGEFSLGLVRLGGWPADEEKRTVYWFARASTGHEWPSTRVKFGRYMDGETWISDDISTSSFLLEVDFEDDLTDSSPPVRDTNPTLAATFVQELRMFATAHGHTHERKGPRRKANAKAKPSGKQPHTNTNAKPSGKQPQTNTNAKPSGKQPQTSANKRARGEGPSKEAQRPRRHA